jgi:hypothetical protein
MVTIVIAIVILCIIASIVAGWIIHLHSRKRRIRQIVEYAEKCAHQGQLVLEAAVGKDIESLRTMARRGYDGLFAGSIENRTDESKELQKAIVRCDRSINILSSVALLSTYEPSLSRADDDLRYCILQLWKAIRAYDAAEEKAIKAHFKIYLLVILCLMLLEVIIIELVSYFHYL